jgi:hypothetical protein
MGLMREVSRRKIALVSSFIKSRENNKIIKARQDRMSWEWSSRLEISYNALNSGLS